MSLCSLGANWSPSDPAFVSWFLALGAWGHPKSVDLTAEDVRNCLTSPPVRPSLSPAPQLPSSPHPPLALLLGFLSTCLSPGFQALGLQCLINIHQGGQHILRCLTCTPHPSLSSIPTAGYLPLSGFGQPP